MFLWYFCDFVSNICTYLWPRWAIEQWILAGGGCQSEVKGILQGVEWWRMQLAMQLGPNFFLKFFPGIPLSAYLLPSHTRKGYMGLAASRKCNSNVNLLVDQIQKWNQYRNSITGSCLELLLTGGYWWPGAGVEKFPNLLPGVSHSLTESHTDPILSVSRTKYNININL